MGRSAIALLFLVAGVAHGQFTCDVTDTTGLVHIGGYVSPTNVADHVKVAQDMAEIVTLVTSNPPDFPAALSIYANGKNSPKSGALRTLKSFATNDLAHEPLGKLFANFHAGAGVMSLDDMVTHALAGTDYAKDLNDVARFEVVAKGMLAITAPYVGHELYAATEKMRWTSEEAKPDAVHAWDEAYAFYAGCDTTASLYGGVLDRATDFGTLDGTNAKAHNTIVAAFNVGRDKLVEAQATNNLDIWGELEIEIKAQQAIIEKSFAILGLQGALKYTLRLDQDVLVDSDNIQAHQAEAWALYHLAGPYVAEQLGVDAAVVVDKKLTLQNGPAESPYTAYCTVYCPVMATATRMGLSEEIGEYDHVKAGSTVAKGNDCSCEGFGDTSSAPGRAAWAAAAAAAGAAALVLAL